MAPGDRTLWFKLAGAVCPSETAVGFAWSTGAAAVRRVVSVRMGRSLGSCGCVVAIVHDGV